MKCFSFFFFHIYFFFLPILWNLLQNVSPLKKFHVLYSFFFVRKIIAHIVTFVFYCVVLPATVLAPEVEVPKWGAVYIPSIITLLNAVGTPRYFIYKTSFLETLARYLAMWLFDSTMFEISNVFWYLQSCRSFHLLIFWILFENVMSLHRTKATFIGLLEAGRVNEWIVTDKLGDALKTKAGTKSFKKPRFRIGERYVFFFCITWNVLFCLKIRARLAPRFKPTFQTINSNFWEKTVY